MLFTNKISKTEFLYQLNGVSVYMKREDLLHKHISGNKFRKLKYNIIAAKEQGKDSLLTFGGAYSNHISATAYAGKLMGLKTVGIIRGEELGVDLEQTLNTNSTLKFAHNKGMQFDFVTRSEYREKKSKIFLEKLKEKYGDFYLVPEGGTNALAIKGCEEILNENDDDFDVICVAVGTGGTISGLINSVEKHQQVLGFPALKGDFLHDEIKAMISSNNNWKLNNEYHFGGFAKINKELISFMNTFNADYKVTLDPIYTAKMMFGIKNLIEKKYFKKNTKILGIHTGGLQGIPAMNLKLIKKGLAKIN